MTLVPLSLPPGVLYNGTRYQSKGRWLDAHLIRFIEKTIRPLGGWAELATSAAAATPVKVAEDLFAGSGNLSAHTPTSGFTAWEYGGAASDWVIDGPSTSASRTGGSPSLVRCTVNLAVPDYCDQILTMTRPGVDGSGEMGLVMYNKGTLAKTVKDGLLVLFERTDASNVRPHVYVYQNGVQIENHVLQSSLAWAAGATKVVVAEYRHPGTVDVSVFTSYPTGETALPQAVLVTDMRTNGTRFGFYDDHVLGSDAFRFGDTTVYAVTSTRLEGVVRTLLGWQRAGVASPYLAIGTNTQIVSFVGGDIENRTPSGLVTGTVDTVTSIGPYGSGLYGAEAYGVGDSAQGTEVAAGVWHLDTFGDSSTDYLVGVLAPSDGKLYYWDGAAAAMVQASNSPTGLRGVVVTPERFLVALGADGRVNRVEWASQESLTDWTPSGSNTAGGFMLATSGRLMAGRRGRSETLLFTDEDLHSMQYVGGTLVYAFSQLGAKCGLIAPNAVAVVDGRAVWMGNRTFYIYDGFVRPAPSEVSDFVFANFNWTQRAKCFAMPITDYGEVLFFYPSSRSPNNECDRYVIWNYRENHWTPGYLSRSAGIDRGAFNYPIAVDQRTPYEHERGFSHGNEVPYLTSGPIELGDGERVMSIDELVPDEATRAGQLLGSLQATLYGSLHPTATETTFGTYTLANPTSMRAEARQVWLRVREVVAGDWRLGTLRLNVRPAGQR
jgi:hypothetical protein